MEENNVIEYEEMFQEEFTEEERKQKIQDFGMHLAQANQLYYQERFEEALEEYDLAFENEEYISDDDKGSLAKMLYWRAETLVKLKQREEAITGFEEIMEKVPSHNYAYSAKNRIEHLKEIAEMVAESL